MNAAISSGMTKEIWRFPPEIHLTFVFSHISAQISCKTTLMMSFSQNKWSEIVFNREWERIRVTLSAGFPQKRFSKRILPRIWSLLIIDFLPAWQFWILLMPLLSFSCFIYHSKVNFFAATCFLQLRWRRAAFLLCPEDCEIGRNFSFFPTPEKHKQN